MIEAHEFRIKQVVIDEVQKIPELLDEVHRLIEKLRLRFLLSGSSARKLKKSGANLLAGRAWRTELLPLTFKELGPHFNLGKMLRFGALPRVWDSREPSEELNAYIDLYLKEEILQEGIVRRLAPFSGFLRLAALSSGQILNYQALSQEIGVSAPTIREYYSILKDTLLAFEVEPYRKTKKRRPVSTSKIYLFDPGITNALGEIEAVDRASNLYGERFEQWIAMELRAFISYTRLKKPLCFWRSLQGHEVDFVIGNEVAIEVKSTQKVSVKDLRGLQSLKEEGLIKGFFLVSQDPTAQILNGITCLHFSEFLERLWKNKILSTTK
jgi:predicted AAA+ superfamily ATPase